MTPTLQVALDAYAHSADQLLDALLEALAATVRERYPRATAVRLEQEWDHDHRLVVTNVGLEDDDQRLLDGPAEYLQDAGWSARIDELLGYLADVRPGDMESISLLIL